MKYIRELHKVCDHVPSVSPQLGKDNRHFIGIIVMVNSRMYAIPITRHDGKPQKGKHYITTLVIQKSLPKPDVL